jgi:hypothetical protein
MVKRVLADVEPALGCIAGRSVFDCILSIDSMTVLTNGIDRPASVPEYTQLLALKLSTTPQALPGAVLAAENATI